ncbi:hypothetical protein EI42_03060 [Thermosporothrix hazakensis]|jgi:hypothetical protein|uniref:Uncharacterized protein n=1 Tax=Thermosporothrix hazakensis TaxID=644383 RepID=A0A326U7A4_THEHA|nr:hypothetical protein [Thermosporothrix hazakensis]PZW29338.1 hypothetical protein EI42_03060 [Thermosporothrix hazakensis]GCE45311.1 hypothetical protein KTH_01800 [Thermosporothrix hazakensis]
MEPFERRIFRHQAVEQYMRRQEQEVTPQLGVPLRVQLLWVVLVLLFVGLLCLMQLLSGQIGG